MCMHMVHAWKVHNRKGPLYGFSLEIGMLKQSYFICLWQHRPKLPVFLKLNHHNQRQYINHFHRTHLQQLSMCSSSQLHLIHAHLLYM